MRELLIIAEGYDAECERRGNFRPGTILQHFHSEGSAYFRITAINKTTGKVRGYRVEPNAAKKEIETYYRNC